MLWEANYLGRIVFSSAEFVKVDLKSGQQCFSQNTLSFCKTTETHLLCYMLKFLSYHNLSFEIKLLNLAPWVLHLNTAWVVLAGELGNLE